MQALERYRQAKATLPEVLIFCRVGESFLTFADDARQAAQLLGIRFGVAGGQVVASFPALELESHLAALVAAGRRVALCEGQGSRQLQLF